MFLKECAEDHFKPFCEKKLPDILRRYGFNNPDELKSHAANSLSVFMNLDCVSVCLGYIRFDDFNKNWMSSDKEIDNKILEHLAHEKWIIHHSSNIGVLNFLIMIGRSATCWFEEILIQMFLDVVTYYGEERFLQVLRFTGMIHAGIEYLYGEMLNRVAEFLSKVDTRCLLGMIRCGCYKKNKTLQFGIGLKPIYKIEGETDSDDDIEHQAKKSKIQ